MKDKNIESTNVKMEINNIKELIEAIPDDTGKLELTGLLEPALKRIAQLNPAEISAYIEFIRIKFDLNKSEVKGYEKTIEQFADFSEPEQDAPRKMTEDERNEALEFLNRPDLMEQTIRDLTSIGIVGEDESKGLLYLSYTSRKSANPISLELRAPSGVGKSYMASKVLELMPDEDVIRKTRITGRYLDYLDEDSLVGKIFMIVESSGSADAEYSIRMMTDDTASGISIGCLRKSPVTGDFEPVEKVVKGPLVYIQTSTRLEANPENESRMFHLYLDDSEEHRAKIHNAIKHSCLPHQSLTEEDRNTIIRKHKNAQRLLEPSPVAISYVNFVTFPTSSSRSTRDLKRFLSLIKTSAFYHQYQRRKVVNGNYILADVSDYEIAYNLASKVLVETQSEINPSSRELLEAAIEIKREKERIIKSGSKSVRDTRFTRKELGNKLNWEGYRVGRAIEPLENAGYFNIDNHKKPYIYSLIPDADLNKAVLKGVLTPDEMKQRVAENLDSIDDRDLVDEAVAVV